VFRRRAMGIVGVSSFRGIPDRINCPHKFYIAAVGFTITRRVATA